MIVGFVGALQRKLWRLAQICRPCSQNSREWGFGQLGDVLVVAFQAPGDDLFTVMASNALDTYGGMSV
jgi:hypothetical protein